MKLYQLRSVERKLAAQISLLLYKRVVSQLASTSGPDPDFRYAGPEGGDFFVEIGLCKKGAQQYEFVFQIDESEAVEEIERHENLTSKNFQTLLDFFFRFFIAHGRVSCLSSTRKPFSPNTQQEILVHCLISVGFLNRHGKQVLWNDTVTEFMEAHGHWQDGISQYDLRAADEDARFEKVYSELPESLIELLAEAAQSHGPWKLLELLPRYYWDGEWLAEPISIQQAGKFGQLGLATMGRIVKKLRVDHGI